MTTDYATRRDTAVADVLAAIDAVTTPRCRTCDTELSPDAPSEDWCSETCAVVWQQTTSPPLHDPDDAGESDAIRLLREARLRRRSSDDPYRIDRRPPGASPLERWAAGHHHQMIETTTADQRVTGDGTGTPLPPAPDEFRTAVQGIRAGFLTGDTAHSHPIPCRLDVAPYRPTLAALDDTHWLVSPPPGFRPLTTWQRLLHTLTAGIRRIRPGRTR